VCSWALGADRWFLVYWHPFPLLLISSSATPPLGVTSFFFSLLFPSLPFPFPWLLAFGSCFLLLRFLSCLPSSPFLTLPIPSPLSHPFSSLIPSLLSHPLLPSPFLSPLFTPFFFAGFFLYNPPALPHTPLASLGILTIPVHVLSDPIRVASTASAASALSNGAITTNERRSHWLVM
jgi:hypothetical protein